MTTPTPQDPKKWQDHYTEKHAHNDSMSRTTMLVVPSLIGIIFPILFMLVFTGFILETAPNENAAKLRLGLGLVLVLTPLILTGAGITYLFKTSAQFLDKFHSLSADEKSMTLVYLRALGLPLLPPPFSLQFPKLTIKDGKVDPPDHWALKVGGPIKLDIQPGNALYLERNGGFSRVVGQGPAFLELDERIFTAVNVGRRSEDISIKAWTKDGIKVEIAGKGTYFLGQERSEEDENILIPYYPDAIRKAVEHTFKSGKEANEWLKAATGQTQSMIGEFISKKYLDELFLKESNEDTLLSTITMKDLQTRINEKLQEYGVVLSNLQLMDVKMNQKVTHQRLKNWETTYQGIALMADGEVKAHQIKMKEKARAEIQRNLIVTIANSLEHVDAANFPEPILLSLSNFLDQGLDNPQIRANVAKDSLEVLEKIQEVLKFPMWLPESDTSQTPLIQNNDKSDDNSSTGHSVSKGKNEVRNNQHSQLP